jgi:S-(hydroxymethyl)glutathione dehydrogenase/alcohol dehydrogenase
MMSQLLRAAVLCEINSDLELLDLDIPALQPGQVLVDIAYSGVCRSQLNEIQGLKGVDRFLPHTLGHEGSGIVRKVGGDVSRVSAGDHVVLSWLKGGGHDIGSTVYESSKGCVNSGAVSTFMTAAVVSANRLVRIDPSVPLKEAALLGCAVPTGAGTVLNIASPSAGHSLAVFGLGGIGQCALIAAKNCELKTIIGVDIAQDKLDIALRLGASHVIDAHQKDVREGICEITGTSGVDFAIEAAGNTSVMEMAFACVCDNGGLCVVAGNPPVGDTVQLDPFDFIKGRRIVGSWGGGTDLDRDMPIYLRWLEAGVLPLSELSGHEYSLGDINGALEDFAAGKVLRPLINMSLETLV